MIVAKIYGAAWVFVAALVGILYFTDTFTYGATMVLGFMASVLAGAGILVVYPALMNEDIGMQRKNTLARIPDLESRQTRSA